MELLILDSLWRRVRVVDKFVSLIWTERFKRWGDLTVVLHSTPENRALFEPGVRVAMNESFRVMEIETIEDKTDEEGNALITVKGRTLEKVQEDRLARGSLSDLVTEPKWILTGLPAAIARQMFHDICIAGILHTDDVIFSMLEGSDLFPDDTIPEPDTSITYEVEPKTLYEAMTALCDIYDMGFRIVRGYDNGTVFFDVYMGSDRTTNQQVLPAVVFSADLENLQNTTELVTSALYKNVAYVISPVGHEIVYPIDVDPDVAGFERRVLFVKADDIEDVDPEDASAKMIQRGLEKLSEHRRFSGFDGEINPNSNYKYQTHYWLGDLVEQRNRHGFKTALQVTEQIFVSDEQGERSYPTLSINQFITPGSWAAMPLTMEWDDFDEEEWVDLP